MRLGILFSGGKDSVNTLWYYTEQGWDIACLLSLIPENPDSFMFQQPHEALLRAQATAIGLPILIGRTQGQEELELEDLRALLALAKQEHGITGVAVGALASDYQHERVTRVCHDLSLKTYAPLWHKDQAELLRELLSAGFDIRMTRIAADGLDRTWLGRRIEETDVDRLIALNKSIGLHPGGEGGEYETIVLNGPAFKRAVTIVSEPRMEGPHRGELMITAVRSA